MPANSPSPRSCARSIEARTAGVKVIGLIGGRAGCYGGGGLIAGCCSALAVSEQGRIGVSGPEVIETNRGVEEFDSRDRALVWRTMGGKHRRLIGGADAFADDTVQGFRDAALELIGSVAGFGIDTSEGRAGSPGAAAATLSAPAPMRSTSGRPKASPTPMPFPTLPADHFIALADKVRRPSRDAR